MYTNEVKKEIERVKAVFKDYIETSEHIDLVLAKFGYVLLYYSPENNALELEPALIEDGCELCKLLLDELVTDVQQMTGNEHRLKDIDPLERAEILRRIEPLIEQLPEYRHLVDEVLTEKDDE